MTKPLTLAAAVLLALAGCTAPDADRAGGTAPDPAPVVTAPGEESVLSAYDLAGVEGREIVDRLERMPVSDRPATLMASVRPGELLVSEAGTDDPTPVALPDDEFYLSVAPFVSQTHECYFHSLTTCKGELSGEEIRVTITDRDSGEVLVAETTTTHDNGFIGYWLPAGIDATVEIAYDGYVGTEEISTGPDDPTCLTTLQLA